MLNFCVHIDYPVLMMCEITKPHWMFVFASIICLFPASLEV